MARRKSKLTRMLDVKPWAYRLFRGLTAPLPSSRFALGFYPDIGPLPDRIEAVAEAVDYRIRLAEPRFKVALDELQPNNWDVCRDQVLGRDPFTTKRFVGIVRDVIVPGHTLTPVDPETWLQIGFEQSGRSNWNFAHPAPNLLHRRSVNEPAVVVPPYFNYWHLFLEHLLPLIQAARLRAWGDGRLVVITKAKRPPLIDAVVTGLRQEGHAIDILETGPREHIKVDRLLVAVSQNWNSERSHGLAEAVPTARQIFGSSYRGRQENKAPHRLYITRRGSKLRQITNEDDLIAALKRMDFSVLQARWDNHPEQLAAFSAARAVVGVHGAGLSNIIFASPGTQVLELFPDDHRKTSMLHLSAEHDLIHRPFFGSKEGHNQAFSVDVDAVLGRVEQMI